MEPQNSLRFELGEPATPELLSLFTTPILSDPNKIPMDVIVSLKEEQRAGFEAVGNFLNDSPMCSQ